MLEDIIDERREETRAYITMRVIGCLQVNDCKLMKSVIQALTDLAWRILINWDAIYIQTHDFNLEATRTKIHTITADLVEQYVRILKENTR